MNREQIRAAAFALLARRDYARAELDEKLNRRFKPDRDMLESMLDQLESEGYLCDQRYSETLLNSRVRRGHGPVRIAAALREKGVEAGALLAHADIDWEALANEVMIKRFGSAPPADASERAKRIRFLQYRGFSAEHFRKWL